jgi:ankyrin repeat protein
LLLDAGADLTARSEDGWTALMGAAGVGTAENVKVLLDAGADASVKDKDGKTAWDLAQDNEKLKGTDAYWMLNDARFK